MVIYFSVSPSSSGVSRGVTRQPCSLPIAESPPSRKTFRFRSIQKSTSRISVEPNRTPFFGLTLSESGRTRMLRSGLALRLTIDLRASASLAYKLTRATRSGFRKKVRREDLALEGETASDEVAVVSTNLTLLRGAEGQGMTGRADRMLTETGMRVGSGLEGLNLRF